MMYAFQTSSSPRRNILTVIFTFIPMFAIAFWGLKIAVVTWIFLEIILLLSCCYCLFLVSRVRWKIEIRGNTILLVNLGNRQSYYFDDLKQSDIVIKQTDAQKQKNCCDMRIQDSPFRLYDVDHCSEMTAYIRENMPS